MNKRKTTFLTCPDCGGNLGHTADSRSHQYHGHTAVRRRRICLACGARHFTIEVPVAVLEQVGIDAAKAKRVRMEALKAELMALEAEL